MTAINTLPPLPFFSPFPPSRRPATELRFSRWNNANAEPFNRRRREQHEIEAEIRFHRRHQSAATIAADPQDLQSLSPSPPSPEFESRGTPSAPSSPSIPGKFSKYSKPENPRNANGNRRGSSHPAFSRAFRISPRPLPDSEKEACVSVGEKGVAYRVPGAPFEFQYSYTETPKVKPLALREQAFLPFATSTMPRPWTGRAPLPPSKKKLPEFDSFRLPPHGKKGVKPVQLPGPFLSGSGPKHAAASREEILGEPLKQEEVKELIKGSLRTKRQLNMGRDGLTHNMLDNIHAHWKRKRVCKIKCKGVCTVDMDSVRQQLEEKTGGEIIYTRGGVIFLFRGRNYNYRTHPRFPLMLWKPVTPVYPKLVKRVPEGLTLEEVTELRDKGRNVPPICKLGKNGMYSNLAKLIREAFEECELVRINCKGLNKSDYRRIGAKLKDLVPCVLLSFEYEHILMWRGRGWTSSPEFKSGIDIGSKSDLIATLSPLDNLQKEEEIFSTITSNENNLDPALEDVDLHRLEPFHLETSNQISVVLLDDEVAASDSLGTSVAFHENLYTLVEEKSSVEDSLGKIPCSTFEESEHEESEHSFSESLGQTLGSSEGYSCSDMLNEKETVVAGLDLDLGEDLRGKIMSKPSGMCLEGVMMLLRKAVESGSAVILDEDGTVDPNIAFQKSVELAKTALPGPVFRQRVRKLVMQKIERHEGQDLKLEEKSILIEPEPVSSEKNKLKSKAMNARIRRVSLEGFQDLCPHGSLGIDELAKLLA